MPSPKPVAKKVTIAPNTINQVTVVRMTLDLPEYVHDQYVLQSMETGKEVEDVMALRLLKCAQQKEDGLWFDNSQKKRLDRCVGHTISNAEGALQRLENLSKITVDDITIELEPRLKQRLASRATMRRKDLTELIRHEVIMGLKRFAGLEPQ